MSGTRYIIVGFVVLIIQLLICEFVNIWPPIYITILPLFILLLPTSLSTIVLLPSAFALGILVDALADGILGLNAASLTATAYTKMFFINRLTKYDSRELSEGIEEFSKKSSKMFLLILFSYIVFFIFYTLLDGIGSGNILFVTIRLIINVLINTLIAFGLERLWIRKTFS